MVRALLLAFALVVGPAAGLAAQDHVHPDGGGLGTVHFTTSCSPEAQAQFDRAVTLLHSFEFGSAVAAFDAALATDAACAITQWGIALSRWANPFAVGTRSAAQVQQGLAAVARGRAIGARTERERAYLEAVATLFVDADARPQTQRVEAYRDAMAQLARRYPDDTEASIFYALSLTAAEDLNDKTYASRLQAVGILEPLFQTMPEHPGLAHYLIHSYDVPALAGRALDAARRYAQIAPAAAHALHMPSHTFTRVGLWQPSIDTNIASAAAARQQQLTSEELHASDYLMYAYLQTAQDVAAQQLLDGLPGMAARFDSQSMAAAAPPSAARYALAAIPARWVLERGAWAEAARLEPRPSDVPYADALTWFARTIGAARSGDRSGAREALAQLDAAGARQAALNEPYWTQQIDIQRQSARAWLAFADGRTTEAIDQLRAAVEAEDRTEKAAVTPGPLAPAREQLAEMLLLANNAGAALMEFEGTLAREPNRFRALAGALRAAVQTGNREAAARYATALVAMCARAAEPVRPELAQARALVAR